MQHHVKCLILAFCFIGKPLPPSSTTQYPAGSSKSHHSVHIEHSCFDLTYRDFVAFMIFVIPDLTGTGMAAPPSFTARAHDGGARTEEVRKGSHETSLEFLLFHNLLSHKSAGTQQMDGFPVHQQFWRGPSLLFLGSGIRYHTLGWLDIQVCDCTPPHVGQHLIMPGAFVWV